MANLEDAVKTMMGDDTEPSNNETEVATEETTSQIEDESAGEDTDKSKKKTGYRYLTTNFRNIQKVKASNDSDINAWKHSILKTGNDRVLFDRRNMVYCANPTYDYVMIYNYYMMLNDIYDDWVDVGRLDQQYLPYIYSPSFDTSNNIIKNLQSIAMAAHVNIYPARKPSSFIHRGQLLALPEAWIKRSDLVALQEYLETHPITLGNGNVFTYNFEKKEVNTVCMTSFFKEFIRLQEVLINEVLC